ncbi:hypothetical protein FUAX_19300 [Fulvitalea axinellae]|uniref:Uncharacterized protein n=1 Tax=Fulvitalea axinellae TaxID=1182444 RepID=A0AAU9CN81_9BACT|nr:hypothetical protein FUAX_19300 [Fulvitalea axinellae]
MNLIKDKLPQIGGGLLLMGLASSILAIFNYNIRLLMWIDIWGAGIGWLLRILFIAAGAAILFFFNEDEENTTQSSINRE